MKLPNELILGLQDVSNQIAGDAETSEPEEVAELCLDANRLKTFGHPEADSQVSKLIKEHGYPALLKEAAKHVYC